MSASKALLGRTDETIEVISARPLELLAATLNRPDISFTSRPEVPPLWHWLYFVPSAPTADLGADGHPLTQNLPPSPQLLRRMFAGGTTAIHSLLAVGSSVRRVREIIEARETVGSSGPLLLVKVRNDYFTGSTLMISETQTIAYSNEPYRGGLADQGPPPAAPWEESFEPSPTILFRFSALTFNAHRIHYDKSYTTSVEGYPDLLVHGPLLAILLTQLAVRHQTPIRTFEFRALAPCFAGRTVHLRGEPTASGAVLRAYSGSSLAIEASISAH